MIKIGRAAGDAAQLDTRRAAHQTDRAAQRSADQTPHQLAAPLTPTAPHPPTKTDYTYSSYTYYST